MAVGLLALCGLFGAMRSLEALQVRERALGNERLFGIQIGGDGQSFYGRHDRVNAVSMQEYQAGPYIVTEVVIDLANNPSQLRLYHTALMDISEISNRVPGASNFQGRDVPEPVQRMLDRGRDMADTVRGERVVKDYPHTTHARTLEYRIGERAELRAFYRAFVLRFANPVDGEDAGRGLAGTVFVLNR